MRNDTGVSIGQNNRRVALLMRPGFLFALFCGVTLGSYLVMAFWTVPTISAGAGGMPILDTRLGGYSGGEARLFVKALSPAGRATYLGPQRLLDTIMPMSLTGTLALAGFLLTRRWSRFLAVALAAVPLAYFTFDMLENAQVAVLLRAGSFSDRVAEAASHWTVLKAQALRFSLAVILLPLAGQALDAALGRQGRAEKEPDMRFTVAIDGPAAAGKGTIARAVAAHFGFAYLDTGLLYRAVGAKVRAGAEPLKAAETLTPDDLAAEGLRTPEVAQAASQVAAIPDVRAALVEFQRSFARRDGGAVLDGRDIGTVICPEADVKLYVTASAEVRAERRYLEDVAKGSTLSREDVLAEVRERDERDATRATAPLKPAEDAVMIDTSDLSIDQAVAMAIAAIDARRG